MRIRNQRLLRWLDFHPSKPGAKMHIEMPWQLWLVIVSARLKKCGAYMLGDKYKP